MNLKRLMSGRIKDSRDDVVLARVHRFDCKGRQYVLDRLAEDLRDRGITVTGTDFDDEHGYDGFVDVKVTLDEAIALDKEYGTKFYIYGGGRSGDVLTRFNEALKTESSIYGINSKKATPRYAVVTYPYFHKYRLSLFNDKAEAALFKSGSMYSQRAVKDLNFYTQDECIEYCDSNGINIVRADYVENYTDYTQDTAFNKLGGVEQRNIGW